jgi:D-serine deaminase-like pyridoxal phosphate-dependent protein
MLFLRCYHLHVVIPFASAPMHPAYALADAASIPSPALLFFKELIEDNLRKMLAMAGGPQRLRPHAKTHKTCEIAQLELAAGICKHKCATIAEADMLAAGGAPDVLIAYPILGPNCGRLARRVAAYPTTRFAVLADHAIGVEQLSAALSAAGQSVDVLLDLDVGQHRTGIAPGPAAVALYEQIARAPGLRPAGFHVYDGHNNPEDLAQRRGTVQAILDTVLTMRKELTGRGIPVPSLVCGGTPSFSVYSTLDVPGLECSPGTCVLHDASYQGKFKEMTFTPAALLLTRVISRPTANRVTFDLGYKAVSADPPAGQRLTLLDLPGAKAVIHNEEHLVVESAAAERFRPGDVALAIPTHVCPTVALHRFAHVIEKGNVVAKWDIVARDRLLRY